MIPEPVLLSWSGGKDSARALHELRSSAEHDVVGLLTTVTRDYDRIAVHGVRRELLHAQARALGYPVHEVFLSPRSSNAEYEACMGEALRGFAARGVRTMASGDIFLDDIRAYRERLLASAGMRGLFPLWGRDTGALAAEFLALGFRAVLVCVDGQSLGADFAGREFDHRLLDELPEGVDPCGERGEFHTFVYDGPGFAEPVRFRRGAGVLREGRFHFCDLDPEAGDGYGLLEGRQGAYMGVAQRFST